MKNKLDQITLFETIIDAYSDCNELSKSSERNLAFLSMPLTAEQLKAAVLLAIPEGYNQFLPESSPLSLIKVFGDDAEYFLGREGSVVVYVRPKSKRVWFGRAKIVCDEFSYETDKSLFRVWWD